MTQIKAKKDLFNSGKCFTKDKIYIVQKDISQESGLMDCQTTNDLYEPHLIGSWWREFIIVKN